MGIGRRTMPQLSLGLASTALCLISAALYSFRKKSKEYSDEELLRKAHEIRKILDPPAQSRFRVVALLLCDDGSIVPGSNDEPGPWIGGAICAERAAFLQLRLLVQGQQRQPPPLVRAVFIVTDSDKPVSPGMMCREFMYGSPFVIPGETRIVLQSRDENSAPEVHTLDALYRYPTCFMRKSVEEQLSISQDNAQKLAEQFKSLKIPGIPVDLLLELYSAAKLAAKKDDGDVLHAIGFGAAAIMQSDQLFTIISASQRKAIEYGSTLDAITQLAPQILDKEDPSEAMVILQVDHIGCIHAPFASARAILVEHGLSTTLCLCTDESGTKVIPVAAKELAPHVPVFR